MFRIKNTGEDFKGKYRHEWFLIPAGAEVYVEDGAVHAWLGNPDTRDTPSNRARSDEWKRIRLMWLGALMDDESALYRLPKFEVYTLQGQRYLTVIDDPKGLNVKNMGEPQSVEDLYTIIRALQHEVKKLGADINIPDLPDVEDEPVIPEPPGSFRPTPKGVLVEVPEEEVKKRSSKAKEDVPTKVPVSE